MGLKPSLQDLSERISRCSRVINAYREKDQHSHLSVNENAPSFLSLGTPPEIGLARRELLEATFEMQQLAMCPSDFLLCHSVQMQQLASLRWLCHFSVPSLVPLEKPVSYADIAAAADVPESHLRSVARMAMTSNFLSEPEPGLLSHSDLSAEFVTRTDLLDWASYLTGTTAPTAAKMVEQTKNYGASRSQNETAYNIAMHTNLSFFDHTASSTNLTQQFAGYMKNVTAGEGVNIKHLLTGYDWASLGAATVVDVGGSHGHASIALASAFPELDFIVQDLPSTIANVQSGLPRHSPSPASRITFESHDFFTAQPVTHADVYLLRMVLHDWTDSEAQSILQHLVNALQPSARIVIMDTVLPRPGSLPRLQDGILRVRDLTMMQAFNSKERELNEWEELLASVKPPLEILRVVKPATSVMSVIEAALVGDNSYVEAGVS